MLIHLYHNPAGFIRLSYFYYTQSLAQKVRGCEGEAARNEGGGPRIIEILIPSFLFSGLLTSLLVAFAFTSFIALYRSDEKNMHDCS